MLGFTGFFWVLLGCTGLYWVVLGCTGFYWVLLGFTGFCWRVPRTLPRPGPWTWAIRLHLGGESRSSTAACPCPCGVAYRVAFGFCFVVVVAVFFCVLRAKVVHFYRSFSHGTPPRRPPSGDRWRPFRRIQKRLFHWIASRGKPWISRRLGVCLFVCLFFSFDFLSDAVAAILFIRRPMADPSASARNVEIERKNGDWLCQGGSSSSFLFGETLSFWK